MTPFLGDRGEVGFVAPLTGRRVIRFTPYEYEKVRTKFP